MANLPQTNEIRRGEVVRRLEPKAMGVLRYFAQHGGEVLSKERLIQDGTEEFGRAVEPGLPGFAIDRFTGRQAAGATSLALRASGSSLLDTLRPPVALLRIALNSTGELQS